LHEPDLSSLRGSPLRNQIAGQAKARQIAMVTNDPHAAVRDSVLHGVLDGAGESDPAIRSAAAERGDVPADLRALVEKIHDHAHRVTDDDIARLQPKYGDDQLFEVIVSAALGASRRRLLAGLAALNDA
jgi:alkylhydroperoxidase family enzyme